MQREGALELAQRLLVRDRDVLRAHGPLPGVAHQVIQRGAELHRVLRVTAGRVEEPVDGGVVDGHLLRRELALDVLEPVVRRDAEAMTAGVLEVDGHGEAIERAALLAEELLEDPFLRAEESIRDAALRLEARAHDVEDARSEAARSLELVEDDDDALAAARGEGTREIERALEEALRVLLTREIERELHVLVLHLHRRPYPRGDRLRLLEGALDARDVLEEGIDEPLAEAADVGRAEAVDVGRVRAAPAQPAQHLEDDRGLPDAPRAREEHVIAVAEALRDAADVRLTSDEVGARDRTSHGEVGRGSGDAPERRRHRR